MNKKTYKILLIITIVCLLIETTFILLAFNYGVNDIANEERCIYEVCKNADTYYYQDGICECYNYNKETGNQDLVKYEN